jgi:hypothetical protein
LSYYTTLIKGFYESVSGALTMLDYFLAAWLSFSALSLFRALYIAPAYLLKKS